jgi:signal transduction histidine kinase
MRELLDDLVNYVRIDETNLELQAVDFDQLMTSVVDDLAGTIAAKQAKIEWLELPQLQGERSLIRVLMQNLVSNAIKFSRRGIPPMVRISAVVNGAFWEIRVEDNGIGIPTAKREKVFDMFQRLHSRKQFAGTGLGLATCRKIAELHGGRIWVSTATGAGCCMHVLLARNNGDNPV